MELDTTILSPAERTALQLRMLYERAGYRKYRVSRFEEYGLYQENRRFLASEQVLTFTDLDGRLLALKPDVTLSVVKNARPEAGECLCFYYAEEVCRPSLESRTFEQISQMGLECIGAVDADATAEVARLAVDTLALTGADFVLTLSHMGFVSGLLDAVGAAESCRPRLLEEICKKSVHGLREQATAAGLSPRGIDSLCRLSDLYGDWKKVIRAAEPLAFNAAMGEALDELAALCQTLSQKRPQARLELDLAMVNEMEYYNGLVLRGYLAGLPCPVLKGGRYDPLAAQFTPGARAMGFALYLNEMERLNPAAEPPSTTEPPLLNVALPKGRLGNKLYRLLCDAGYGCAENAPDSRKLVLENPQAGIRCFLVKPSDVAIYVEHGAADVGFAGKDILAESGADVYELLDTGLGKCRMCVAGRTDFTDDPDRALRVATKFVSITKNYYAGQGRDIDIIRLNGSIELAPLLGLSDVIVDIVETGATLKENDLRVLTEFMPISARFIANKASYPFKRQQIDRLLSSLAEGMQHDKAL